MKGKMQKITAVSVLAVSVFIAVLGIVFLHISCDGSCGASNHGGMLQWICTKFFVPTATSITMIVIGSIGAVASVCLFAASNKKAKQIPLPFSRAT